MLPRNFQMQPCPCPGKPPFPAQDGSILGDRAGSASRGLSNGFMSQRMPHGEMRGRAGSARDLSLGRGHPFGRGHGNPPCTQATTANENSCGKLPARKRAMRSPESPASTSAINNPQVSPSTRRAGCAAPMDSPGVQHSDRSVATNISGALSENFTAMRPAWTSCRLSPASRHPADIAYWKPATSLAAHR